MPFVYYALLISQMCFITGRNRTSCSAVTLGVPCCAYIEVQVSLISGAVVATGCISHAGHDPEEKIFRPPDCVLGKLKGLFRYFYYF